MKGLANCLSRNEVQLSALKVTVQDILLRLETIMCLRRPVSKSKAKSCTFLPP